MVEIDEMVIDFCQKYLPKHSAGAYADPRLNLIIKDGAEFVKETLKKLVGHYFKEEEVIIQQKLFSIFGTPAKLAKNVANFFYASYALPENMKPSLLDDLRDYFKSNEKILNQEFRMPINRLVVRG